MIERLPLDLFDDIETPVSPEAGSDEDVVVEDEIAGDAPGAVSEPDADALLVTCQWCSTQFDNELPKCPDCNALHIKAQASIVDETIITCQWCLDVFDAGPTHCPSCNARVVVAGQRVLGENDVPLDFNRMGILAQRAHTNQMLAGMMLVGGIDDLAAGLIGIAFSIFDDD